MAGKLIGENENVSRLKAKGVTREVLDDLFNVQGLTKATIAKRYGVTPHAVALLIKQVGLEIINHETLKKSQGKFPFTCDEVRAFIEEGLTDRAIAEKGGVLPNHVTLFRYDNGIHRDRNLERKRAEARRIQKLNHESQTI